MQWSWIKRKPTGVEWKSGTPASNYVHQRLVNELSFMIISLLKEFADWPGGYLLYQNPAHQHFLLPKTSYH